MLDDFGTLPPLGSLGEIDSLEKLREYVFSGFTGPTGRPVALFSFALNAQSWPASPVVFLATNIAIHSLNTLLLYFVLHKLFAQLRFDNARRLALLAVALWALSPSHVSTVLYVVQRMTQLELFFNLCCIWCFLSFRFALYEGSHRDALVAFTGLGGSALLAVLSKENAILIPLQLWLIDSLLRIEDAPLRQASRYTIFKLMFIVLPSLIVIFYLISKGYQFVSSGVSDPSRSFTFWERILSEFRIVGGYLYGFLMPQVQGAGVFYDGYEKSTGWLTPVTTLLWFVFHAVTLLLSWVFRRRFALIAFGVFWFYVNHILESTVLQLELKFEHRNYLPSIGIALFVVGLLRELPITRAIKGSVVAGILLVSATILFLRSSLWGSPLVAVGVWAQENPHSFRVREFGAMLFSRRPDGSQQVERYLEEALALSGNDPVIALKKAMYQCRREKVSEETMRFLYEQIPVARLNWQVGDIYESLGGQVFTGQCKGVGLDEYRKLISVSLQNESFMRTGIAYQLRLQYVMVLVELGEFELAENSIKAWFYGADTPLGLVMRLSISLATHGEVQLGYALLDTHLNNEAVILKNSSFLVGQASEIRENIRRDL